MFAVHRTETSKQGGYCSFFYKVLFPPSSLHVLVLDISQQRKQKNPICSPVWGVAKLREKSNFITLNFQLSPYLVTNIR